jgi:hypothetical protein
MNISKWLPKPNNDMNKIFIETRSIERELRILGKKFATNVTHTHDPDYNVSRKGLNIQYKIYIFSFSFQHHLLQLGVPRSFKPRQYSFEGKKIDSLA